MSCARANRSRRSRSTQKIVDTFVTPDVIVSPTLAPRVVSQSIAPGIKVAKGASVDITLAPRNTIPIDVIVGVHEGFRGRNVGGVVDTILTRPEVVSAVLDFETAAEVPAPQRAAIEAGAGLQRYRHRARRSEAEFRFGIPHAQGCRRLQVAFRSAPRWPSSLNRWGMWVSAALSLAPGSATEASAVRRIHLLLRRAGRHLRSGPAYQRDHAAAQCPGRGIRRAGDRGAGDGGPRECGRAGAGRSVERHRDRQTTVCRWWWISARRAR